MGRESYTAQGKAGVKKDRGDSACAAALAAAVDQGIMHAPYCQRTTVPGGSRGGEARGTHTPHRACYPHRGQQIAMAIGPPGKSKPKPADSHPLLLLLLLLPPWVHTSVVRDLEWVVAASVN